MNIIFVVANTILFKGSKLKIIFSKNPNQNPLLDKQKNHLIDETKYKICFLENKQILLVNEINIFSIEMLAAFTHKNIMEKYTEFYGFVRTVKKFGEKDMHAFPNYHYNLKLKYFSAKIWIKKKKLRFLEGEDITNILRNLVFEISCFLNEKIPKPIEKIKRIQKKSFRKEILSASTEYNIGVFQVKTKNLDGLKNSFYWYGRKNRFFDILIFFIKEKQKIFLSIDEEIDLNAKELLELASNSDSNINGNKRYAFMENCSKKEFKRIVEEVVELV